MIQAIFILVVAAIIVFVYAATRPDAFNVQRSLAIKAAPEKLFPLINDFRQWDAWTPYDKDPAMKRTYSGSASGKGASYAWEGNREVGMGSIEITASSPPTQIDMHLHMIKPFEGHNHVTFTLLPVDDATTVTWAMEGRQAYLVKVMSLFVNMDNMVGKDFEVGLAKLKAVAER